MVVSDLVVGVMVVLPLILYPIFSFAAVTIPSFLLTDKVLKFMFKIRFEVRTSQ
jgi:hypothetical protein